MKNSHCIHISSISSQKNIYVVHDPPYGGFFFFNQLLIYSSLDDNHTYCIRCYTCAQRGNYMNYDVNYIKEVLYHAGECFMGQLRDDQIYSKGKDDYVT